MQESLVRKIEKAKKYAEDPSRVKIRRLEVGFRGDHGVHNIRYDGGKWSCDCNFFSSWGTCSHIMALERLLGEML